jgi:hypothetical protein
MAAPYSPCRIQRRLSPTLSHDLYHFRLRNFLRRHLDALRHPVQFYVRPCFDLLVGHEIDAAAVWSVYGAAGNRSLRGKKYSELKKYLSMLILET